MTIRPMIDRPGAVRAHYEAATPERDALLAHVAAAVDALEQPLDARRLEPLDQFHLGGLAATEALALRAGIAEGAAMLDAGSGLGGPARYLAEAHRCRVEGVDLSPDCVAVARMLSDRAGLSGLTRFREGDIADLPFEDGCFDLVWTQHVAMNVADRAGLAREFRRVLKPGGRLAFHDPLAADGHPEPFYPVPWAATSGTSTLLTAAETRATLEDCGFRVSTLEDVTDFALARAARQGGPRGSGLGLIFGDRMAELAANYVRNLREGCLRVAFGIAEAG